MNESKKETRWVRKGESHIGTKGEKKEWKSKREISGNLVVLSKQGIILVRRLCWFYCYHEHTTNYQLLFDFTMKSDTDISLYVSYYYHHITKYASTKKVRNLVQATHHPATQTYVHAGRHAQRGKYIHWNSFGWWDGERITIIYINTKRPRFEPHNQNNLIIGGSSGVVVAE